MTVARPEPERLSPGQAQERLRALLRPWDRADAPGVVMAVRHRGRVLLRHAVGLASLQGRQALTPSSRLRSASISKQFTSLLVLLLAEDGLIDLDTPVRLYAPEMEGPGGEVTARQLMQHRGGLRCFVDLASFTSGMAPPPIGAALALTAAQRGLNLPPGDAMLYSNGGYHLLSLIAGRVAGAGFAEALADRVLAPLGLWDTALAPSDRRLTEGLADQHQRSPDGAWLRGLDASDEVLGEGGLVSTVDDLLRWTALLLRRGPLGSPATWRAFLDAPPFPGGARGGYGCGVQVRPCRGAAAIAHGGFMPGAMSHLMVLPGHALEVVVLSNGALDCDPTALAHAAADIVLGDALPPATPPVRAEEYRALLGLWLAPDTGMTYRLFDQAGELRLALCGYPPGCGIERGEGGRLVVRANSFEPLELEPAAGGAALAVHFGSQRSLCERLDPGGGGSAVFAGRAAGDYYNPDCDCALSIRAEDGQAVARFTSPHGAVQALMSPVSDLVAHLAPFADDDSIHGAVVLRGPPGAPRAIEINTLRTRGLRFEPVAGGFQHRRN